LSAKWNKMGELFLQGISVDELLQRLDKLIDEKLVKKCQDQFTISDDYITRKEVAKLLRISLPTLHDWTKTSVLPSYKMQSRVLYKRSEVEKIIAGKSISKK